MKGLKIFNLRDRKTLRDYIFRVNTFLKKNYDYSFLGGETIFGGDKTFFQPMDGGNRPPLPPP